MATAIPHIRALIFGSLGLFAGLGSSSSPALAQTTQELQNQITALTARVAALEAEPALGDYVTVDTNEINGMAGPHLIFTGVNLHLRSGGGETDDAPPVEETSGSTSTPQDTSLTGKGNLIIGYNERSTDTPETRTGSHNLVIGSHHSYISYGGLVAGKANTVSGPNASVSGGNGNTASGLSASVSGGSRNTASGVFASVSGGSMNAALGPNTSVGGGWRNTAGHRRVEVGSTRTRIHTSGSYASVSGGRDQTVAAPSGWTAGGFDTNTAAIAANKATIGTLPTSGDVSNVQTRLETLEDNAVLDLGEYVSVDTSPLLNGVTGPHVIFSGVNLHLRSGSGETDDNTGSGETGSLAGKGNLIIGYNEETSDAPEDRAGSHNLVIGPYHTYSNYGGLVAGSNNTISGNAASVIGGRDNAASGSSASVSGGQYNEASGQTASVSGGWRNVASGSSASVSGGRDNEASGGSASVSGGRDNTVSVSP